MLCDVLMVFCDNLADLARICLDLALWAWADPCSLAPAGYLSFLASNQAISRPLPVMW